MQAVLLLVLGSGTLVATAVLARRDRLTMRFVLAWSLIAIVIAISGLLTDVLGPIVADIGMTPTGLLLGISSAVLLLVCLQLSFDASNTRKRVQDLTEANALLRLELEQALAELRAQLAATATTTSDPATGHRPTPGPT